jgi:DNA polymerase-3 subunit gamma/tau
MTDTAPAPYRVLARKYRPATFAELVGQEAMVRTLSNAIASGRLAHAFILTGVRGVGKTTTARIIARALNCTGPDGKGGPTVAPCGQCESCRSIAEDRNIDVQEMDAASRTGIGDIREIIESVRYAPAAARYKIYIIDEVHMLSNQAFNGLLKTLEEPPAHVKFIFATTEIRKLPVTVLSRCQRFDLRRVDAETLMAHLRRIAEKEGASIEPEALALIARAAEGSVRDALSLLDQAIAHGNGVIAAGPVRDMLGLADRGLVFDVYERVMRGDIAAALTSLREQYDAGADPLVVLQDMLELTHWLTRIKVTPAALEDVTASEVERRRGKEMAAKLTLPILSRTWQMLLKGLGEARQSSQPLLAAEMVLIRLAYAADLPSPADLVRELKGQPVAAPVAPPPAAPPPRGGVHTRATGGQELASAPRPLPEAAPQLTQAAPQIAVPDFAAVVALAGDKRDALLKGQLVNFVHLVRFEPGRIEFRPARGAPADLAGRLAERLREWTGQRWVITIAADAGEPTLGQRAADSEASRKAEIEQHPLIKAVIATFPGATIQAVRDLTLAQPDPGGLDAAADDEALAAGGSDGDER